MRFQQTIIMALLILSSCANKAKDDQQKVPSISKHNKELIDHQRLFDGTSLSHWEVTNFGPQGKVYVSGDHIVLGMGDGCTGITWKDSFPKINYEITLEAKRMSGNDFFCGITFPVNDTYCSLIVGGWAGVVVGLSTIDGKDGSENETTLMKQFNQDEWYAIRLRVSETKIQTWINNEALIDFTTAGKTIDIRPEVSLSKPFGIATWKTTGAIRNIYLRKL